MLWFLIGIYGLKSLMNCGRIITLNIPKNLANMCNLHKNKETQLCYKVNFLKAFDKSYPGGIKYNRQKSWKGLLVRKKTRQFHTFAKQIKNKNMFIYFCLNVNTKEDRSIWKVGFQKYCLRWFFQLWQCLPL